MIQFFNLAGKHYTRIQLKRVQGLLLEKNMLTVKRLAKTHASKKRLVTAVHDLEQNIMTYYKNEEPAQNYRIEKLIAEVKELQDIVHAAAPGEAEKNEEPHMKKAKADKEDEADKLLTLARKRKIAELERLHTKMKEQKTADRDEINRIAKKISRLKEEDLLD